MAIAREINHVGIRTSDMAASLHLYRDLLGGKVIRDARSADGTRHIVYVQLALGVVELIGGQFPPDTQMGLDHIAFLISEDLDIHAALAAVQKAGYESVMEPRPATSGEGYIAFFRDKAGCRYELMQRNDEARIADLKNERIKKFDHISIRVDNESEENTRHLITNVLGLPAGRTLEIGSNSWKSYCLGSDSIGLFNSKSEPRPEKPLALLVFDVFDCTELHRFLSETNVIGLTDIHHSDILDCKLFFATGPDGERLEFLER